MRFVLTRHAGKLAVLFGLALLILLISIDAVLTPCDGTCGNTSIRPPCESGDNASATVQQPCVIHLFILFTEWISVNLVSGCILYALLYAACVMTLVPTSTLTIGAGAAFSQALGVGLGIVVASLTVFVGASVGAIMAFLLGRYALRECVSRLLRRWKVTAAIDVALGSSSGLKLQILLRVSPIIPFNVFNYAIAGTGVSFRHYVLALPAMLPVTATYAYIGVIIAQAATAAARGSSTPSSPEGTVRAALLAFGAAVTLGAVGFLSWAARRELNKGSHHSAGLPDARPGSGAASTESSASPL
jgi:uncharacterized membrane protein YdjX (TVP38/TMEM64 family)